MENTVTLQCTQSWELKRVTYQRIIFFHSSTREPEEPLTTEEKAELAKKNWLRSRRQLGTNADWYKEGLTLPPPANQHSAFLQKQRVTDDIGPSLRIAQRNDYGDELPLDSGGVRVPTIPAVNSAARDSLKRLWSSSKNPYGFLCANCIVINAIV